MLLRHSAASWYRANRSLLDVIFGTEMRIALWIFGVAAIVGCSGGDPDPEPPLDFAPPPQPPNTAPTISGSPAVQVVAGQPYSFTPTANDADGDTLTFTINNQPSWTDFSSATGSITGTPQIGDIGTASNVEVSVSDGTDTTSLAPFNIEVQPVPVSSVTVLWDPPTVNADGSALDDLAGFNVHYGQQSGIYDSVVVVDSNSATAAQIGGLTAGAWFFAVSAYDTSGNESTLSSEVSKMVVP